MLPSDPDRLVFPPFMFVVLFIILYNCFLRPVSTNDPAIDTFFRIGFVIGYFMYDCTHYALHHVDTRKNKGSYFHRLQRYHNQHHFGLEQAGYGVSSKLWDIILRTGFKNDN